MPFINEATREIFLKIVYYGPGLSGKTTNLEHIHTRAAEKAGDLIQIKTAGERTLYFDYFDFPLGELAGYDIRLKLYTVPGQVYYQATRRLVLNQCDGIVFVADSQMARLDANLESLDDLEESLESYGRSLKTVPHVFQWNKRDLDDITPTKELDRLLNTYEAKSFEAIASEGTGCMTTLKSVSKKAFEKIREFHSEF